MIKNLKNKKSRILIVSLLIVIVFSQFLFMLFRNKDSFLSRGYGEMYSVYHRMYHQSQYTQKKPKSIITDEIFESYAGGAFLKGLSPILIVHDHPPMGRYIVSLSILLFDNSKTIIIFMLLLTFLGIYLTSRLIFKDNLLAVVPLFIFANEPLTLNKLLYAPLPEPIHLPFIIFSIYFFMRSLESKKKWRYYIIVSILLGFVISIRFFVTGGVVLFAMMLTLLVAKQYKEILKFGATLPLSIVVLVASYTRTIMDSGSVFQVFSIQKYILAYHKSAFTNAFSYWDLLLFNRWHTWWGERRIMSDPQWTFLWPASTLIAFLGLAFSAIKRIRFSLQELVVCFWVIFYSLMLSTGYTSTRYFFPVLPYLYILMVLSIIKIYGIFKKS